MNPHPSNVSLERLSLPEILMLARSVLLAQKVPADTAQILAERIEMAERDGPASHGLFILPSFVSGLRSHWIDGLAQPKIEIGPGAVIHVDGLNGFAQTGLDQAQSSLMNLAKRHGVALLTQRNAHHIGALRSDVEPFAVEGLIALMCVATRRRVVPHGGRLPFLGTNPMAFAAPVQGRPPFVWDMATSASSVTDVRMAAEAGLPVAPGTGVDKEGQPTTNAQAIIDGGALLNFGGHKGSAISLMVEILAAGLSGGNFAIHDRAAQVQGAASANGGQCLIVIDPQQTSHSDMPARLSDWFDAYVNSGAERLPGDGRLARRQIAMKEGVLVPQSLLAQLRMLT